MANYDEVLEEVQDRKNYTDDQDRKNYTGQPTRQTYRVYWIIDIYASSPREAALDALRIQRDPMSEATLFQVEDVPTERDAGLIYVDLHEYVGEAIPDVEVI